MSATFVIFGNVGNVMGVLRPSSDTKMTEDSTGDEISVAVGRIRQFKGSSEKPSPLFASLRRSLCALKLVADCGATS